MVSTSYLHVNLDGLKLNGADLKAMLYAIIDCGSSSQLDPPWT